MGLLSDNNKPRDPPQERGEPGYVDQQVDALQADQRAREEGRQLAVRLGDGLARRVFAALGLVDRFDVLDAHPNG